jgi:hypothetical protein
LRIASDHELLHACVRPADKHNVARRDIEGTRQQAAQRVIRLALVRRRGDPRLEHGATVGKANDAVDGSPRELMPIQFGSATFGLIVHDRVRILVVVVLLRAKSDLV